MGKRGPKARDTAVAAVRLPRDIREKLEQSAKKNDRSLSREIESRLTASLDDGRIAEMFSGEQTYQFARLIAMTMRVLREKTGHWWHEDRFTFDLACQAIEEIERAIAPAGPSEIPEDMPLFEEGLARMDARFGVAKNAAERAKRVAIETDLIKSLRLGEQTAKDVLHLVLRANATAGLTAIEEIHLRREAIGDSKADRELEAELEGAKEIGKRLGNRLYRGERDRVEARLDGQRQKALRNSRRSK